jgi:hypothetical protein
VSVLSAQRRQSAHPPSSSPDARAKERDEQRFDQQLTDDDRIVRRPIASRVPISPRRRRETYEARGSRD